MNMDERIIKHCSTSRGINFFEGLTLLFIGLKLTGYVEWSWVWVLSPIWIGLVCAFVFLALLGLCSESS